MKPSGIEEILSRFDGKRQVSPDSWNAPCPAHDDKTPSLSIRDVGNRTLIHCFAGCATEDVLAAVGLTYADLYRDRLPAQERRERAVQATTRDLEAALWHELLIMGQTLSKRVAHRQIDSRTMPPWWKPMPAGHWEREAKAAQRIVCLIGHIYGVSP